jgi:hypothetical protein
MDIEKLTKIIDPKIEKVLDLKQTDALFKKVLESEEFQKINLATKFVATAGNPLAYPRIISLFRKDFWKEFIND